MTVHEVYGRKKEAMMASNGNGIAKFTPGAVAEVIALARLGEEVTSNFEPFRQLRFELADGRTWYASLATGVKISNLEIGLREPFRVCKRQVGNTSTIDVLRCAAAPASPSPAPQANVVPIQQPNHSTGTVMEAKLEASIAAAKRPASDRSNPAWAGREMDPNDPGYDPSGERGRSEPFAQPRNGRGPSPASPYLMTGSGQAVLEHYNNAVDVAIAVRKYATSCGLDLGPTSFEDIRCMAATSRISAQGGR